LLQPASARNDCFPAAGLNNPVITDRRGKDIKHEASNQLKTRAAAFRQGVFSEEPILDTQPEATETVNTPDSNPPNPANPPNPPNPGNPANPGNPPKPTPAGNIPGQPPRFRPNGEPLLVFPQPDPGPEPPQAPK
jgi:hypothetical protein